MGRLLAGMSARSTEEPALAARPSEAEWVDTHAVLSSARRIAPFQAAGDRIIVGRIAYGGKSDQLSYGMRSAGAYPIPP